MNDAFGILFGLRRATQNPRLATGHRIGSPPDDAVARDALLGVSSAYEFFRNQTFLETDRIAVYNDCDEMMNYILIASAMHAYVEDGVQPDHKTDRVIWPESANPRITAEIARCSERLELDDRAYGDLFWLGKYGDHMNILHYDKDYGVTDATPLEPRITHRHENYQRQLLGFSIGEQVSTPNDIPMYKPWDVVHFRLRTRRPLDIYGTPFFFDVRLIYRTLKLMEEQMAVYRMNMHPDRLLFKVFVGNSAPDEAYRIIRKWRQAFERILSFNQSTDRMTSEYAPWAVDSSIWWPQWAGDDKTGVEKFPGSANVGDIFDVQHVRDLLFAGLRVPKAYMGFEDSQGYRSEDTLSQQSIKFARGVKRLRHFLLQGYTRLFKIHLELRGYNTSEEQNQFKLMMAPVSYLDDAHRAELVAKRMETVRYMIEMGDLMAGSLQINKTVWASYVLSEYGGLEPELITKLMSPMGAGGDSKADIVFAPQGSQMMFEKERLTQQQKEYVHKKMQDDPKLGKLLENLIPIEAISTRVEQDSASDARFSIDRKALGESVKGSKGRFEEALEASGDAAKRFEEDRKKRYEFETKKAAQKIGAGAS